MKHIIELLAKKYNNKKLDDKKIAKKLKSYNGKDSFYNNNYYELTEKNVSWGILKRILESNVLDQLNKVKKYKKSYNRIKE